MMKTLNFKQAQQAVHTQEALFSLGFFDAKVSGGRGKWAVTVDDDHGNITHQIEKMKDSRFGFPTTKKGILGRLDPNFTFR